MEFSIDRVRQNNGGTFASITFNGRITVNDCRIATTKTGKEFVAMPQRMYTDRNGVKKWSSIVFIKFTDEENEDILNAIYEKMENSDDGSQELATLVDIPTLPDDEDDLPF